MLEVGQRARPVQDALGEIHAAALSVEPHWGRVGTAATLHLAQGPWVQVVPVLQFRHLRKTQRAPSRVAVQRVGRRVELRWHQLLWW